MSDQPTRPRSGAKDFLTFLALMLAAMIPAGLIAGTYYLTGRQDNFKNMSLRLVQAQERAHQRTGSYQSKDNLVALQIDHPDAKTFVRHLKVTLTDGGDGYIAVIERRRGPSSVLVVAPNRPATCINWAKKLCPLLVKAIHGERRAASD